MGKRCKSKSCFGQSWPFKIWHICVFMCRETNSNTQMSQQNAQIANNQQTADLKIRLQTEKLSTAQLHLCERQKDTWHLLKLIQNVWSSLFNMPMLHHAFLLPHSTYYVQVFTEFTRLLWDDSYPFSSNVVLVETSLVQKRGRAQTQAQHIYSGTLNSF